MAQVLSGEIIVGVISYQSVEKGVVVTMTEGPRGLPLEEGRKEQVLEVARRPPAKDRAAGNDDG